MKKCGMRYGAAIHSIIPSLFLRSKAHFNFCAASLINIFSLNIGPQEGNTESERKRKKGENFLSEPEKKLLRNKKRRKSSQDKEKERGSKKRWKRGLPLIHSPFHSTISVPFRRPNIPTFVEQVVRRVKKSGRGKGFEESPSCVNCIFGAKTKVAFQNFSWD